MKPAQKKYYKLRCRVQAKAREEKKKTIQFGGNGHPGAVLGWNLAKHVTLNGLKIHGQAGSDVSNWSHLVLQNIK
jgi:hypothetical protein